MENYKFYRITKIEVVAEGLLDQNSSMSSAVVFSECVCEVRMLIAWPSVAEFYIHVRNTTEKKSLLAFVDV